MKYETAVHEAGHCVVAHCYGWPIDYVTIKATDDTLGLCDLAKPLRDDISTDQYLTFALGGSAAEIVCGVSDVERTARGAIDDWQRCFELQLRGGEPLDLETHQANAEAICVSRLRGLRKLANALMLRKRLKGYSVNAILTWP